MKIFAIESLECRRLFAAMPLYALPQSIPGGNGYTPAQIRQAYGFNNIADTGSGMTIAIVDAYGDGKIASDLNTFDQAAYGSFTPAASTFLSVENQTGGSKAPKADPTGQWQLETSLDVEWAHAMAPGAKILLVEATSGTRANLLAAVDTAAKGPGVVVVSMSWGFKEFSTEASLDSNFVHTGVTFVAASGDAGTPSLWPAYSPDVVSVGGTSLTIDGSGNYVSESTWNDGVGPLGGKIQASGGGISEYEPLPSYQDGLKYSSLGMRFGPDVSYNADPNTGFAIYDSNKYEGSIVPKWTEVGGTSAGAPQWAALIAIADQMRKAAGKGSLSGASQTLPAIYAAYNSPNYTSIFHDIIAGDNGTWAAAPGYDLVTGVGSPYADQVSQVLLNT